MGRRKKRRDEPRARLRGVAAARRARARHARGSTHARDTARMRRSVVVKVGSATHHCDVSAPTAQARPRRRCGVAAVRSDGAPRCY